MNNPHYPDQGKLVSEKYGAADLLSDLNLDIKMIFQEIVDNSPLSIFITDLKGTVLYISRAALKMGGFDRPEELIGKDGLIFMDPKDHDRARKNLSLQLTQGRIGSVDYTLVRKDGSRYIGSVSPSLLRDGKGQPVALVTMLHDRSDVQESKEQFQFLFENTPAGVGISRPDGRALLGNEKMAEIFGGTPKKISETSISRIAMLMLKIEISSWNW